ncbi:hypothetical protein BYT27DRAFT_7198185 [Phlegmacium glaucopus]|nr:hypothetical protein BYT27DRAFT_7198185 [Phlegmacium glaucopus]
MATKLSSFSPHPPILSPLLKKAPDAVPPTDELEQLHAELRLAKQKAIERSKKANDDLKTIEESIRRMTEREKGKFKAIDKIKRERDYTPLPDAPESKSSTPFHGQSSKPRIHSHPTNALPSSSSRSSLDPRRSAADELKKKKKKRKREGGDSDIEPEAQRPRKLSPPVIVQPPKAQKSTISANVSHKTSNGPDFSIPPAQQLLPPRPPIPPPPIAGPSKPSEVMEDFSRLKQPSQTVITTFYSSIEPFMRNIKEEDVGFLEYTGDEVEPYVMPKLGRHYLEVWEDQDMGLLPPLMLGEPPVAPPSAFSAPTPKWDSSTLTEADLLTEDKGHGPLTERVISALLPIPDLAVWKGVKAAEDAMEGRPGGSGAAAARRERLNVTDLEGRIRDTMRYHGLLNFVPDFSERVDDPIATALREAQRELRKVVATNKARKARLISIACDRLGYQEYLEVRDSIDKNITTLYHKLQKKDVPKVSKKKKKPLQGAAAAAAAGSSGTGAGEEAAVLPQCPAAVGLTQDDENHLAVNEQLKQLVETRKHWVDTVGAVFDAKELEMPGRLYGLPKRSVFEGVEEEVQAMLAAPLVDATDFNSSVNGSSLGKGGRNQSSSSKMNNNVNYGGVNLSNGKGKERARNDAMDIG